MPVNDRQLSVVVKDEVTLEIPVPATADQTQESADHFKHFAEDGYVLRDAKLAQRGQRDPFTVGVRLTFVRRTAERTPTSVQCGAELGGIPTCGPAADCAHGGPDY